MHLTKKHNIPVFAAYEEPVKYGAVMGLVIDEYAIGFQAGLMAAEILQGKNIKTLMPVIPTEAQLFMNAQAAKNFNIDLTAYQDQIDKIY